MSLPFLSSSGPQVAPPRMPGYMGAVWPNKADLGGQSWAGTQDRFSPGPGPAASSLLSRSPWDGGPLAQNQSLSPKEGWHQRGGSPLPRWDPTQPLPQHPLPDSCSLPRCPFSVCVCVCAHSGVRQVTEGHFLLEQGDPCPLPDSGLASHCSDRRNSAEATQDHWVPSVRGRAPCLLASTRLLPLLLAVASGYPGPARCASAPQRTAWFGWGLPPAGRGHARRVARESRFPPASLGGGGAPPSPAGGHSPFFSFSLSSVSGLVAMT